MESNPSPQDHRHDQDILDLLESLESARVEYPPELLAARRAAFLAQLQQHSDGKEGVKKERPARQQFTKRLKELQTIRAEYPADLLAARRAAFIAQVEQHSTSDEQVTSPDRELICVFETMKTAETEYPPDLLAARRAAFVAQLEQQKSANAVEEQLIAPDEQLVRLFKSIKAVEPEYSPRMMAAQRSAFTRQVARGGAIGMLDVWVAWIQRLFLQERKLPSFPSLSVMRTSAVIAVLMVVAYIGSLLNAREPVVQAPAPDEPQVLLPGPILSTDTAAAARIICKPGYLPPLCLAKESEPSENLTYQGNGVARPAVAKDTLPGYSAIHKAAYVNDGLYGPGASWISNSPYSWIKIDLGKATSINTVTFGRDRLGNFNDRDPGQFVIAVALSDDVYADGNSSNDYIEYTQIYNSEKDGFSGVVAGPETVRANFGPIMARYVKITFANPGAAVDEVEVFMVQPPVLVQNPTRVPKDDVLGMPPTTAPSRTPLPTLTSSPVPTDTPAPTDTSTPRPTNTPEPTDTSTPRPTRTPTRVPTDTPLPTRTPTHVPTDTPLPTRTPTHVPTDTPRPTRTPLPEPTDTPLPTATPVPTATSVPTATDVPPPTDTPVVIPTETPMLMDEVWPPDIPPISP